MKNNCKYTVYACYLGYITQAIINNFTPLLFLTLQSQYGISIRDLGLLVSINFGIQILADLLSPLFVKRFGYRSVIVSAHIFSAIGLSLLGVLPQLMENTYLALMIATAFNAVSGGIIEVLVSPITQALPGDKKEQVMSLLHSFYCWGHVGVVLISTAFFLGVGISNWYVLAIGWSLVPILNSILFSKVPIYSIDVIDVGVNEEKSENLSLRTLVRNPMFLVFVVLMICSGASEQAMSQWASYFAEQGLQIPKAVGDLLGPCLFAVLMGIARLLYGKYGDRIRLDKFMLLSAVLCIGCYLLTVFGSNPMLSLIGCAVCGFSVGIFWPGTFSLAANALPTGGTLMFALFAVAGDIGCALGPGAVGFFSSSLKSIQLGTSTFSGIKIGLLFMILFPILMMIGLQYIRKRK